MAFADALMEAMASGGKLDEGKSPPVWAAKSPGSKKKFGNYLVRTLGPDLDDMGYSGTADDVIKAGKLILKGKKDPRYADWLKTVLIPDLWQSGQKQTAKDLAKAVKMIEGEEGAMASGSEELEEAGFQKGQRVQTPLGPGQVAYQRMGPPNYSKPVAVSVVLDAKQNKPGYTGTMFDAKKVKPLKEDEGEEVADMDRFFVEAAEEGAVEGGGGDILGQLRKIVSSQTMGKVDGMEVDLYTASAVTTLYDALSSENQAKFKKMPLAQMIDICLKILSKED